MSKGSGVRPHDKKKFDENYERVFGVKKLNNEEDTDGIQGNTGDGARDQADSGRNSGVPQEPNGQPDSQAAEPVEPPLCRNCGGWGCPSCGDRQPERSKHPLDTDYWTYSGYRGEFNCPHGVGHGLHVHGCDGCCKRDDFPLKKPPPCRNCGSREYTPGGGYCDVCGGAF